MVYCGQEKANLLTRFIHLKDCGDTLHIYGDKSYSPFVRMGGITAETKRTYTKPSMPSLSI